MKNITIVFLLLSIFTVSSVHSQKKDNLSDDYYSKAIINIGKDDFIVSLDSMNLTIKNVKNEIVFNSQNVSGAIDFSLHDFNNDGIKDIQLDIPLMPCGASEIIIFDKDKEEFKKLEKELKGKLTKIKGTDIWFSDCSSGCGSSSKVYSGLFKVENLKIKSLGEMHFYFDSQFEDIDYIQIHKIQNDKIVKVFKESLEDNGIENIGEERPFIVKYWNKNYKIFE